MSELTTEERSGGKGFLRRNGWLVAMAAILAVLVTVTGLTWVSESAQAQARQTRIEGLQGELEQAQRKNSERIETDVLTALGVSRSRLNRDAPILADLARTAFTWDSGESYEQARGRIKDRFKLTEKDAFLTDFMPPSRYSTDAQGKRYYYIDAQGMNSSLKGDPTIDLIKVVAGDYQYAVVVTVDVTSDAVQRNNSNKGQYSATRQALIFVTVDAQGQVSDVSGVPASGSTRHSG